MSELSAAAPATGGDTGIATADTSDLGYTSTPASPDSTDDAPPPIDPGFGDLGDLTDHDTETADSAPIKLVVNGKEIEKSPDEVKALAQKYLASETKLETLKKERAELDSAKQVISAQQGAVKQLLTVLQQGDINTIAEFAENDLKAGDAFKKGIIQYAMKLYELSKMSPEAREAMETKKQLEQMRRATAERDQREQQQRFEYEVNQWSQHLATELPKAITTVGLTDTPFIREQIAQTWKSAIDAGKAPTATAVAAHVKKRLEEAKMLGQPTPPPAAPKPRPRATRQSVGMNGKSEQPQYTSFDEWRRSR